MMLVVVGVGASRMCCCHIYEVNNAFAIGKFTSSTSDNNNNNQNVDNDDDSSRLYQQPYAGVRQRDNSIVAILFFVNVFSMDLLPAHHKEIVGQCLMPKSERNKT